MTETLYPHQVVLKWFKDIPVITLCIAALMTGAVIILCTLVVENILMQPDINDVHCAYSSQQIISVSPLPFILALIIITVGVLFTFNLLSRGRLL
jgi:hypothetical protein